MLLEIEVAALGAHPGSTTGCQGAAAESRQRAARLYAALGWRYPVDRHRARPPLRSGPGHGAFPPDPSRPLRGAPGVESRSGSVQPAQEPVCWPASDKCGRGRAPRPGGGMRAVRSARPRRAGGHPGRPDILFGGLRERGWRGMSTGWPEPLATFDSQMEDCQPK